MADIATTEFKIVQVYGGLKEAFFTVDLASAADVLKFTTDQRVSDVQIAIVQTDVDGANVPYVVGGLDSNEITIGAGPAAEKIKGTIKYRAY